MSQKAHRIVVRSIALASFGATLFGSAVLGAASARADVSLADVQSAIAKSGATWVAGPTTVSTLPVNDRKGMMGVAPSLVRTDHFFVEPRATEAGSFPAAWDWRNKDGKNYDSPMLDQGRCGSCVAFATVATLETQTNIAADTPSSPWRYSTQYLFSCGGGSCSNGWEPEYAMQYLVDRGTTDEACHPYASGSVGADVSCSSACSDASSRRHRILRYTTPTWGGTSVDDVKRALMKGPLETTMTVYEDFSYYTGGVYRHVSGAVLGGHAITIIGWSDTDRAWTVRNSWGTGWGEAGYFRIAWNDTSGLAQDTWGIELPSAGAFVTLGTLRDKTVVSGVHPLSFVSRGVDGSQITWTLKSGSRTAATGTSSDGATGSIDTSTVADGAYLLTAEAVGGASPVRSDPRLVYVLNGDLTGAMRFKTLSEGQTLRGKVTFNFTASASPVPVAVATFTATEVTTGTVKVSRATGNTGPEMQMGWNTANVPNGRYRLKLEGSVGAKSVTAAEITVTVQN